MAQSPESNRKSSLVLAKKQKNKIKLQGTSWGENWHRPGGKLQLFQRTWVSRKPPCDRQALWELQSNILPGDASTETRCLLSPALQAQMAVEGGSERPLSPLYGQPHC